MKICVVGAGLAGAVAANLLSKNHDVEVFEMREHIGGNCYDEINDGHNIHKYGPHIFHTDNDDIWQYVNRFAKFKEYKHSVIAKTYLGNTYVPVTNNSIFWDLCDDAIIKYIFEPYTFKQWGLPFNKVPKSITNRLQMRRIGDDISYFLDKYQGIPIYSEMINNMLYGINIHLKCGEYDWRKYNFDIIIYTGRLDRLFNKTTLKYRTIDFKFYKSLTNLESAVINNCIYEDRYTRVTDNSFWTNKIAPTILTEEYPRNCEIDDIPCYPINDNIDDYLANLPCNVILCGRLAKHLYLDMDDTITDVMQSIPEP